MSWPKAEREVSGTVEREVSGTVEREVSGTVEREVSGTTSKDALRRLVPGRTLLLVVDVQERLASAMPAEEFASVVRNIGMLLGAAAILGVPVAATEQYPKGLGRTVAPIADQLVACGATIDEKLTFSAAHAPGVLSRLAAGADTVLVAGMESHVCVFQTVRDLLYRDMPVQLVTDAVISRQPQNRAVGVGLCERAGAVLTSTEAVIFDWLERAGSDAFRAVSKLVR